MGRCIPSTTDQYVTMHVRLSRTYAAAYDSLCDYLGVNRSELLEASVKGTAARVGKDMPSRLPTPPIPADACYERFLKVS